MLPTPEVLKGFVLTRILPVGVAALTTWLMGTHVLSVFNFNEDEVARAITEIATFGISYAFAFLGAHHALKGTYIPTGANPEIQANLQAAAETPDGVDKP